MPDQIRQGTPEWHAARLGKVTASRISDVMARTKSGWGASRKNYAAQLVAERLTGTAADSYTNASMLWGLETEPEARRAYEFYSDADVAEVGFIDHPDIDLSGASPDGLVDDDGMVEIKCPNTATHIETLLSAAIPAKYQTQMLWQMACAERHWCDFVSYDPRLPEEMRLFVKRLERDDEKLKDITACVRDFLAEVAATETELTRLYGLRGPVELEKAS